MTIYTLVSSDHIFKVPNQLAICPYCDGQLYASVNAWTQHPENKLWTAEEIEVECKTQPDFDDQAFDEWASIHTKLPYVYWLPVEEKIKRWINGHVRFICENS